MSKAQTYNFNTATPDSQDTDGNPSLRATHNLESFSREMANPYLHGSTTEAVTQSFAHLDESEMDDETKNSQMQSIMCYRGDHYKFAFVTKGNCLIYIGLSRCKHESVSFVKK